MKEYYDTRAPEYDAWWHWSAENREGWSDELAAELGGEVLHAGTWFVLVRA